MRRVKLALLLLFPLVLLGNTCATGEFEQPAYELGESGVLVISNPTAEGMALGGCNPVFYDERLPGRWVPDPFIRPACVFFTFDGEPHLLPESGFIPPGGSVRVMFPTDWLSQTPGIMRVRHRVSTGCAPAEESPGYVACTGFEELVTAPLVVFEPGTTDATGPRPPELF